VNAATSLATLSFFTMCVHPFATTWAAAGGRGGGAAGTSLGRGPADVSLAAGVAGTLVSAALLMGLLLALLRRWPRLPAGALSVVLVGPLALLAGIRAQRLATGALPLVVAALVAGAVAEGLLRTLRPSSDRPLALRLFAFAVPAVLYALYYLALLVRGGGIGWSLPFWSGTVVQAGLAGLLLSYLAFPPTPATDR
jgi:hypothetical protein